MTVREFIPRPYQGLALDFISEHPRCALWAGMGMGKTTTALTMLDNLTLAEDAPALVLAPLRVARSTWPTEAKKWRHLSNVEVMPVIGSAQERHLNLFRGLQRGNASVFTTNFDNLPWLVETLKAANKKWPFRTVIADEATRLKSFRLKQGGKRAAALGEVAHKHATRFVELTGTPSPNGLKDLWGQMWFIDAGKRLGRTYQAFSERWFRMGYDKVIKPVDFAKDQIHAAIRDVCLTLDARDWFDIKEPIVTDIFVDLPRRARMIYSEFERKMFASIGEHEIEAFNAAALTIKCLQLANGAAYVEGSNTQWAEVHDEKLQALDSIVTEAAGMPVLVAYHFKSDLARLQKAFPQGRVLDAKPSTEAAWNAGEIPILFAHPASAGHGLNLQDGGNILVYFGHWWSLEERMQIVERIGPTRQAQSGHDRPVFVYNIIARDTVDEQVIDRVESKRDVQELLLEAMKRRAG